jgi:hypothetical protein
MPIPKDKKHLYGLEYQRVRAERVRATGNRCEGCGVANGRDNPFTGSRVVLTLAHLDHTPGNDNPGNLRLWCQLCHNRYDAPVRAKGRRERRRLAVDMEQFRLDIPSTGGK